MNLVTLLGNTYSGTRSIYEYLIGRGDTLDPVKHSEFKILSDPGGINDLYSVYNNYSLKNFNFRLKNLIEIGNLYFHKRNLFKGSLNLFDIKNYPEYWEEYLDQIKGLSYKHRYINDDLKKNKYKIIAKRIINRLSHKNILCKNYWTGVTKREFEIYTYQFFKKIFLNEDDQKLGILYQCGNFLDPIESTKLIGEPKIIIVTRNPYDQFADLKEGKGMLSSKEFTDWFIHLKKMESSYEYTDERILKLEFEDFVLDHETIKNKICAHLGIDNELESNFKIEETKRLIGKFKETLSNEEISHIKNSLKIPCINLS